MSVVSEGDVLMVGLCRLMVGLTEGGAWDPPVVDSDMHAMILHVA